MRLSNGDPTTRSEALKVAEGAMILDVGKRGPKPTQPCGTYAAHRRHKRACEQPCEACAAAWAAYQRELYVKRKGRTT